MYYVAGKHGMKININKKVVKGMMLATCVNKNCRKNRYGSVESILCSKTVWDETVSGSSGTESL